MVCMAHRRFLLMRIVIAVFMLSAASWAGTFTAATCNRSDVNAVINGPTHTAVDGDIIQIPSGSCTWTTSTGITVPSNIGITIAGSGTPNSTSGTTVPSSSCGSGTTITLQPASGTLTAFQFRPQFGNSTSRLSCMTLALGSPSTSYAAVGLNILGTCTSSGCPNLRMDNITFTGWTNHANNGISYGINAIGDVFGVIDHNHLIGVADSGVALTELSHASYLGVGSYGDNSWAQPENYGSANFMFFENNTLDNASLGDNEGSAGTGINEGGGRVVARYNILNIDQANVALSWHGTESNGRPRGGRTWEFYGNTLTCRTGEECLEEVGPRSGTGLTWNNAITGTSAGIGSYVDFNTYRTINNFNPWGACDGASVYDTNDGTTYDSSATHGTAQAGSSTDSLVVSGTPWSASQWVSNGSPYSLIDTTKGWGSEISASTTNTITTMD